MTNKQYADWLNSEITDAKLISDMAESETKQFWNGKLKAFQKASKKFLTLVGPPVVRSIVVFKDGSHVEIEDGVTWEFENDPIWLITINP